MTTDPLADNRCPNCNSPDIRFTDGACGWHCSLCGSAFHRPVPFLGKKIAVQKKDIDGFPRRAWLDYLTPIETAIWITIQDVEEMGCHPFLTEAVILLQQAREKIADFVELDDR